MQCIHKYDVGTIRPGEAFKIMMVSSKDALCNCRSHGAQIEFSSTSMHCDYKDSRYDALTQIWLW